MNALDLYASCQKQVAAMAREHYIDRDDARQHFLEQALLHMGSYNPNHPSRASLSTYILGKLKDALREERGQNYDAEEKPTPAALLYTTEIPAEPEPMPLWRTGGDEEIIARIGILPPLLRGHARALLRDHSRTGEAAEAEGVTSRAVRYRVAKVVKDLRDGAGLAQPDLFGEGELV